MTGCKISHNSSLFNQDGPKREINYKNNYESFENLDFDYTKNKPVDTNQILFHQAINYITLNQFDTSENILRYLHKRSIDNYIKSNSIRIIYDLLFFKSRWKDIIDFDTLEYKSIADEDNVMLLAEAFSTLPEEKYIFNNQKSEFDIQLSPSNCPIIPVLINGNIRYFWFDTGANYTALSSDIARECNVNPIIFTQSKALTSTTRKINIYPSTILELQIGDVVIKNHPVIIVHDFDMKIKLFASSRTTKIDGIIGWKAIQNLDVTIDYKNYKMIIRKPEIRSNKERNFFWFGCPIVKVYYPDGTKLNFSLDLGSERTCITNNIFKKIKSDEIYQLTKQTGSAGGWVYFNSNMMGYVPVFIDNHLVEFMNIGTNYRMNKLYVSLDGILGSDFLIESTIRIDWLNGVFEFIPGKN